LNNAAITIRYVSPLARSQRVGEVQAMDRFEAGLAAYAEVKPELMDIYDWDGAQREKSWNLGVPQKFLISETKVKAMRTQRAQQQEQAQAQAQEAEMMTKAAPAMMTKQ
jgi:fido (protein-threonine AMPylation protein)